MDTDERYHELRLENDKLKQILADSNLPCIYCHLSKDDMNKCLSGFPGCARADDMNVPDYSSIICNQKIMIGRLVE